MTSEEGIGRFIPILFVPLFLTEPMSASHLSLSNRIFSIIPYLVILVLSSNLAAWLFMYSRVYERNGKHFIFKMKRESTLRDEEKPNRARL